MFANPGSTEIPFLTDLPDDLRFVLGLHEGSVVGWRPARARPRRARARPAPHDRRSRQRGQRARDGAREPLAARRPRRPAGPPPPRYEPFLAGKLAGLAGDYPVRSSSRCGAGRARGDRARLPRRHDVARAGARDRPDGRLGEPADEEREPAAPVGSCSARALPTRRPSTRSPRFLSAADTRARRRRRRRRPGDLVRARRAGRAARRPRLPGVVRRPRRVPAGPPAVRRALPADRPRLRETLAPTTPSSSSARPSSASPATHPGRFAPGHAHRPRHRRPRRGAPQPRRARRPRAAGGRLPRARRRVPPLGRPARAACAPRRRSPAPAEPMARATSSRRSPSACPRRGRARGVALDRPELARRMHAREPSAS